MAYYLEVGKTLNTLFQQYRLSCNGIFTTGKVTEINTNFIVQILKVYTERHVKNST